MAVSHLLSRRQPVPGSRLGLALALIALIAALVIWPVAPYVASAANPAPVETYFVPLPDDYLMQMFEDVDADGGERDAYPPVRDVIAVSVSASGTLLYWDQWEDGGYDADIANPGANIYNASTNPDGTQIWGDSNLANGCPPRFRDDPNPCSVPAHDTLDAGDVIVLDNLVPIHSSGGLHGPWLNGRWASEIHYDGKDKFAVTASISATRAGWTEGSNGSYPSSSTMFSDAIAIESTANWGSAFVLPIGKDTPGFPSGANLNYSHVTIQAGQPNTTVCVDRPPITPSGCAGSEDRQAVLNPGQQFDPSPMPDTSTSQGVGDGTEIRSDKPVQVILVTADVNASFATRWFNIEPRADWRSEYYNPIGTADPNTPDSSCGLGNSLWAYNPNATAITVYYDFPGGASPDGSWAVAANASAKGPLVDLGQGAKVYTTGSPAPVFYPLSISECSYTNLADWGLGLIPVDRLTDRALVGWAPGCTTTSGPMECIDQVQQDTTGVQLRSRSVVWLTTPANTWVYVDTDGSGISCPGGAGADRYVNATALTSYDLVDDPVGSVCDLFHKQEYDNNGKCLNSWAGKWDEKGDGGDSPLGGAIYIKTDGTPATAQYLYFTSDSGSEAGRSIQRAVNLAGNTIADLKFKIMNSQNLEADDDFAVEISSDGGATWTTIERFDGSVTPSPSYRSYDISPYISANTTIRFLIVDDLETNEAWAVDSVGISFGTTPWDFDLSGAELRTCDGTPVIVAWGENPWYSYWQGAFYADEEALDMATTVFPLGAAITIDKSVDKPWVMPGEDVTYTYLVRTSGAQPLTQVSVVDDKCAPTTYVNGDAAPIGQLDRTETWTFTCKSNIYRDTLNTAYSTGSPDGGASFIRSLPDQALVRVMSTIGDYVWVDEDEDADQDAGEPGIPNVKLTLTGTAIDGTTYNMTTYTDANGGYLFSRLKPANASGYTVTVDSNTVPAGYRTHPTYDEDGTGTPHTAKVVLPGGVEHDTTDFGYTGVSAIGDTVWIDSDGDGLQDTGEVGLGGVGMQLLTAGGDGLFGTGDDVVAATQTTNNNGYYLFDGLSAGAYVVKIPNPPANYTQTGDPDGVLDHKTTNPILLAPGDPYLNADFGYRPASGADGAIGDTVWFDQDKDNIQDVGEKGLVGVTVALIRDLNANGAWEAGEPLIASDITDANGIYGFAGLPVSDGAGTDDYLVWVNDIHNTLSEYKPSYDVRDAGNQANPTTGLVTGLRISAVMNLSPGFVTDADFAFFRHTVIEFGLIGDTIFLDRNANNTFEWGEGIEGVDVLLYMDGNNDGNYDAGEFLAKRSTTNENGIYHFEYVAQGAYVVMVDTSTLPPGLNNTYDPDTTDSPPNESGLTLPAGQANLLQDFGYQPSVISMDNALSGAVWKDLNFDGTLLNEPGRFADVTIALYRDTNANNALDGVDQLMGTTVTAGTSDGNGNTYAFDNLPNGVYFVDVQDDLNILNGYWKSNGPNPGLDNNSQIDPYTVSLSGGVNNLTADFGYYAEPANIGDYVWVDANGNGVQDSGEAAVANATVTLSVAWPSSGGTTTLKTTTNSSGIYAFKNVLLDEDLAVATGANRPTFTVRFTAPTNYGFTTPNVGNNDAIDSDADRNTGSTTAFYLKPGQTDNTWDAGLSQTTYLGDFAWEDLNGNGLQDAGEPGLSGVPVYVRNTSGVVVEQTETGDGGGYGFLALAPGNYSLRFEAPPEAAVSYYLTWPNVGNNDLVDSDPDPDNRNDTEVTTLSAGEQDPSWDAGFYRLTSIGDTVWRDLDADGIQDAGEPGVNEVEVSVHRAGPSPTSYSATTNANGIWQVTDIPPGEYYVQFTAPPGYAFTKRDQGSDDAKDSDADANGATASKVVLSGQPDMTFDAGLVLSGALGDKAWIDTNRNGQQDTGEAELGNVTVNVRRAADNALAGSATTNSSGVWNVTGLGPDNYVIEFVKPAGYVFTTANQGNDATDSDPDPTTGKTATKALAAGETDNSWDAGFAPTATIGDRVWVDTDGDGIQDSGEDGLANVTVKVRRAADDSEAASVTTNSSGIWTAANLAPGDYLVEFIKPAGYLFTIPDVGADGADSDADQTTGRTQVTTLDPGENDLTWDAGVYRPAALGDLVWEDMKANGIYESGDEFGIAGATVEVYRASDNTVVDSTTTNASGIWTVDGLPPGAYYVKFVKPDGYFFTTANAGTNDQLDSDADPATGGTQSVTVASGQTNNSLDAGLIRTGQIGDWVWVDADRDGVQDGGEAGKDGVTVELHKVGVSGVFATAVTSGGGNYLFDNLMPGDYYVDFALPTGYAFSPRDAGGNDAADSDADTITGETIANTLEPEDWDLTWDAGIAEIVSSIAGQVREDLDADGDLSDPHALIADASAPLATVDPAIPGVRIELWSDPDGNGNESDGALLEFKTTDTAGNYIFTDRVPGNYVVVEKNLSGYISSGDLTPPNDDRIKVALTAAPSTGNDFLDYRPVTLGDKVWLDADRDGQQDAGEQGMGAVMVNVRATSDNSVAKSATTDSTGIWGVNDLKPGSYYIEFVLPAGYAFTLRDQGNDQSDSDADTANGRTASATYQSNAADTTLDAGLILGSLGDRAWVDTNGNGVQNLGEPGLGDVVVTVRRVADGTSAGTTTTNSEGLWTIAGLTAGDYYVEFAAPTGYVVTQQNKGADDQLDSDADPTTGKTATINVSPGEVDNSVDAGLVSTNVTLAISKTRLSNQTVWITERVAFRIAITNTSSLTITHLPLIDLYSPEYIAYGFDSDPQPEYGTPASNDNVDDGHLDWTDLTGSAFFNQDLAPGASFAITVVYTGIKETINLPNQVTVNTARVEGAYFDPDGDGGANRVPFPTVEATATQRILRPTSVELTAFTGRVWRNSIRLSWETANEAELLGFNLWRKAAEGEFEPVNQELILARSSGLREGSLYRYVDFDLPPEVYVYRLEAVLLNGVTLNAAETKVSSGLRAR